MRALAQRGFQGLNLHSFGIDRHPGRLQARDAQHIDAAEKTGVLDRDLVARDQVRAKQPLDGVHRPVGQVDVERRGAIRREPGPRIVFQARVDGRFAVKPRHVGPGGKRRGDVRQPGRGRIAAGQIHQRRIRQRAFLLAGAGGFADERSQAPLCHGDAGGRQPLIGGGDRIAVDVQLDRQVAHGRQGLARPQLPRLEQRTHAVEDLGGGLSLYFHVVPRQCRSRR
ncbi:hypothetical protein D9M68_597290 [compost metagenome]